MFVLVGRYKDGHIYKGTLTLLRIKGIGHWGSLDWRRAGSGFYTSSLLEVRKSIYHYLYDKNCWIHVYIKDIHIRYLKT